MCQLNSFCFCLTLRFGCLVASIFEFILIIFETILCSIYIKDNQIDSKALIASRASVLTLCSVLLFVGALKRDRICAILHALFLALALFTELIFEIFLFNFSILQYNSDWVICYVILDRTFFVYMIFASSSLAVQIKNRVTTDIFHEPYRQRLMSSALSSEIYGV